MGFLKGLSFLILLFISTSGYGAQERYISLTPATTEILFALGLKEQIVGVTTYCNYPEEAKKITKVGTFSDPNIEKILSLKPSMVFAAGLEQAPSVIRLQKLGIKVIVSDPKNFPQLFESIMEIGSATGRTPQAKALIEKMQTRLEAIKAKTDKLPLDKRPKVFIEIWYDPVMTAGPGSFVDQLITLAGGKNIAYDAPRAYSRFSSEAIIERNPDVIILGYMDKDNNNARAVKSRMGWQNISGVKNNRLITKIDPDLILRPGPRLIDGLEEIYRSLNHEQ